jgi:hypothetical protein
MGGADIIHFLFFKNEYKRIHTSLGSWSVAYSFTLQRATHAFGYVGVSFAQETNAVKKIKDRFLCSKSAGCLPVLERQKRPYACLLPPNR